jgi:hypothetical protein
VCLGSAVNKDFPQLSYIKRAFVVENVNAEL